MIPGLFNRQRKGQQPLYKREQVPDEPFHGATTIEDKIKQIIQERRFEAYQEDVRRARIFYKVELFYRGYQNLGPWDDELFAYPVYDEEPQDFGENRFRRNALILAGLMVRMETTPVIRPDSDKPLDLEAAIMNEDALELIHEHIGYDQLKADKALMKVLFGNAFIYSDYQVDRRFGTLLVPKFKYESVTLPGAAICPQCGMTSEEGMQNCRQCGMMMQQIPSTSAETQIPDGVEERIKGQEFSIVCSPLEIKCRSKVKGGLENAPYLLWITKEDIDAVKYIYPQLDVKPQGAAQHYGTGGSGEYENALRYQDILAALPGNIWGGVRPYWATTNYFDQVDVVRAWIRPQLYKNDPELLKEAPDGLRAIQIEGELAEWQPERMDDHWTHELYIPNPHSFYGDGLVDDVPLQRALNTINQLMLRWLEYATVPTRLVDSNMIIGGTTSFSNDPAKRIVEVQTDPQQGHGLDAAVRDLGPQQLSLDVPMFKGQVYQASNDVTGATDPIAGKIAGANTPYSAQALANEQGQIRHLPSIYYNTKSIRRHTLQLLSIAEKNWLDPRRRTTIDPTTGKPRSVSITGADLSRGNISIKVMTNDFKPKTRAETLQALDYLRTFGIDPTSQPRMRLEFFERVGFTPEGDMLSTQTRRAYRQIERMKAGQSVTPDPLIDDGLVQAQAIQEYLASKEGEQLLEENQQAFQAIRSYMVTVMQMAAMKQATMTQMDTPQLIGGEGAPMGPSSSGQPPAKQRQLPGGQPGGSPELAQSPVPEGQQQPMAPLPAGARQA